MPELDVNENQGIYYGDGYWNELEPVQRMFSERISSGAPGQWFRGFSERHGKPFKRALILNCGNGWVEREMASANLFEEAVGIDYSEALLDEARLAATAAGLPLTYRQMNINKASFEDGEYDLAVNHAAAHHIAQIDHVFREICRILPEDGWFLSLDYVGPHRNQYTTEAWEQAWRVNEQLPAQVRQSMSYPHLPTMLHDDPTEAIHSELIVETLQRYFHVERFVPLGGAIAYPLLTFNDVVFWSSPTSARKPPGLSTCSGRTRRSWTNTPTPPSSCTSRRGPTSRRSSSPPHWLAGNVKKPSAKRAPV